MTAIGSRRATVAGILAGLSGAAILVAGCSSPSSTSAAAKTSRSAAKAVYATVGDMRVRVPTEIHGQLPSRSPNAAQAGQEILITPGGIRPSLLLATQGLRVVWTNLTDQPQQIIFTNASGGSGPIRPGGTFSIATPRSESYTFRTASGLEGVLNVDPDIPGLP